jgi:hypothetical protein
MEVTEERLGEVLARGEPGAHLSSGSNAVPSLVVESMAATHPEHAERIREAGHFLCGLLWAHDGDGDPTLTLSVAMHTFLREERTTPARMRAHLSRTTHRDLLLGLSAHALLSQRRGPRRYGRGARETEAVLRTLYLLVRMYETQEGTATPLNGRWRRHESREEASMIL